jgi:serine phosphatase RsbU (regulator of sigma subunit)/DNA-binding LacI/PurR family transcriptional regulator
MKTHRPAGSSTAKKPSRIPGRQLRPQPGNKLLTIGLLTEGLTGQYQAGAWPGIVDAARLHNVNIICFSGGSLCISAENPWDHQGNVLYKIAEKYPLDGLIIAGSVGCFVTDTVLNEFLAGYRHLKAITIAPASESMPAVYVDNRSGMKSLITHLVECHSCRNIAFIKGPDRNLEAEERFLVFKDVMDRHAIPLDPQRILQGDFTRHCGATAIEQMISSATEFDAIVSANDDTALGALQALQERGIRVPEDVALVGFDDIDESGFVTPPLTTVHQPLYDLGKLAVEKLLLLLKGETVPKNTIVAAKLVVRQSCGCFRNRANGDVPALKGSGSTLLSTLVEKAVAKSCIDLIGSAYQREAKEIASSFCCDVNNRTDESFLRTVDRIGYFMSKHDNGLQALVNVLHHLGRYSFGHLEQSYFVVADELLHRAISLCGNIDTREHGIRRIRSARQNSFLREIGNALNNTLDFEKLMNAIGNYFPQLGIHTFYLSLYERPDLAPTGKSRLKCVIIHNKRKVLEKAGILFETMSLVPSGTVTDDRAHIFVAEALYFQNEQFGIALFEADLQDCGHYRVLKDFISGALHSASLIRKVRRQADVLSKANAELKKLREEEHAYLQAIKRELDLGRKIQMGFLPRTLPQVPGWEIAAAFEPAREVSGDFYDAFMLGNNRIALVIADISGKDVSAALFMSLIRTLIRVFAERAEKNGDDPLDAITVVNDYILRHHISGEGHGSMFATIVFGILRTDSGEFRYVNAGHIAPMIINNKGEMTTLAPTAMAVGLSELADFHQQKISIKPGDLFFFYTDGVTEAKNPEGDFFTKGRLKELLLKKHTTARKKVDQLNAALTDHQGGAAPYDDITILAVKRE